MAILMKNRSNPPEVGEDLINRTASVDFPKSFPISIGRSAKATGKLLCRDAFLISTFLIGTLVGATPSRAESLGLKAMYLGGVVADMSNLAVSTNTIGYRSIGGGFYAHESYVIANTSGNCPKQKASKALAGIIKTFGTSAGGLAEVGLSTPLGLTQLINCNYRAVGLNPTVALANIVVGTTSFASWKSFVDAGKTVGLIAVGPIVSPNVRSEPADWNDKFWNDEKRMALYGGVLGMDTPPDLYKALGSSYITFAQQQLAWCKTTGVSCIDIVSPGAEEKDFYQDALAWAYAILAPGVFPASWVIENYNSGTKPSIGAEQTAGSLTNAALAAAYALQPYYK